MEGSYALFSKLSKHRTPRGLVKTDCGAPSPSVCDSADLGGAPEPALLASSQVMRMLLVQGPLLASHSLLNQDARTDLGVDSKHSSRMSGCRHPSLLRGADEAECDSGAQLSPGLPGPLETEVLR